VLLIRPSRRRPTSVSIAAMVFILAALDRAKNRWRQWCALASREREPVQRTLILPHSTRLNLNVTGFDVDG
jgi:hypothetical protein